MQTSKTFVAGLVLIGSLAASTAYAGPPVTVTFKNEASEDATYTIVNANESSTYANASPKPDATVNGGGSDIYMVQSLISPDANYATVRYRIGSKECRFDTSYVKIPMGGVMIPQWNENANGSGGAICTANITSTNLTTHEWSVDFIMR
ncbi:hypothetical protein [Vreelandella hamiltonii]|uniref:Uncharacterized protein n=2 Tax=Halomonadaceae TaxID=28256 RepID=A0A8H9I8D3_9GAMM|nr:MULTISPECIES: hypothetical protein [Halomonas]GGW42322.1 hypothetical protein GCM10007157_35720 [Halomonas hamiltonii]GGW71757.1 hypothetical protein GCM10007158_35140 [Halomonas johnsoniae]